MVDIWNNVIKLYDTVLNYITWWEKKTLYEFKINPGFAPCCKEEGLNGKFIYERNINGKTWYFASKKNKGHGRWIENRLNPLTGEKK